ncbi:MAG: bifunctional phosphoribosylaminoimidazolecarboxamide formyltransferase/IMP cyclohydrolase [Gammaproteobacteria bacterium]|nr:bifunctional phosphoribosylaminoimidazolecarboxamide formyltransferase/IMP cyclohydrolase [Gammaproteobacteria bacterium]
MRLIPIKRALLSVSDKTGIVPFAQKLNDLKVEIISTGGTSRLLSEAGIPHQKVEEVTGLPEMLEGRVKTLHPKIHGGILGRRDKHAAQAVLHEIDWIDLVVVNFYPFQDAEGTWDEVIEYIDIGGPAMARAAAKNFAWVGVVVDPHDYLSIMTELESSKSLSFETRENLAAKTFAITSTYDAMVADYFNSIREEKHAHPSDLNLKLTKQMDLRYGENPHQRAYAYQFKDATTGMLTARKLQGKPLSYNNLLDAEAAVNLSTEFTAPTCVIVKHGNPCGVASALTLVDAYVKAFTADSVAAFGGIVALNYPCDDDCAGKILANFTEMVIAPAYSEAALARFAEKPNLRLLLMPEKDEHDHEIRFISGGILLQEKDKHLVSANNLKVVTQTQLSQGDLEAMAFAWKILKHIKSNAILLTKGNKTVGIGAGQVSRIDAVEMALKKAGPNAKGAILASDAFFPFRDSIDTIAQSGIGAIVQPGGSIRDEEVIAACNEHGIPMAFTGVRCFKH